MEGMDERDGTHQVWTITGTGFAIGLVSSLKIVVVHWRNDTPAHSMFSMFAATGTWEAWRFAWRVARRIS